MCHEKTCLMTCGSYKPAHMHRLIIDCYEYSEIRPGLNTGWENSFLVTFKSSDFFSIHTAKIDVVSLAISQLIQGMGNRSECTAGYFYFTNSFKRSNSPFSLRKHANSNILKTLPPKNENFQIKKIWYFSYFCSTHILWVLIRTASLRQF